MIYLLKLDSATDELFNRFTAGGEDFKQQTYGDTN